MKAQSLIAAAWLGIACSAAGAEAVPKPKPRPPDLAPASPSQAMVTPAVTAPLPRLRPGREAAAQDQAPPQADGAEAWPAGVIEAEQANCRRLLDGLDIDFEQLDPIERQGGCGAAAPIAVRRVAGVALSPPATQTCAMAAALVAWVAQDVQPAARKHLRTEVTEIHTATSYACRRRNNGASGKMSEHSKANALDMSGFSFARTDGVTVEGSGGWGAGLLAAAGLSRDGAFLEDIRKKSCAHFTTVLGPGSDPFHGDHFHVDVLQRKGGYRICQ